MVQSPTRSWPPLHSSRAAVDRDLILPTACEGRISSPRFRQSFPPETREARQEKSSSFQCNTLLLVLRSVFSIFSPLASGRVARTPLVRCARKAVCRSADGRWLAQSDRAGRGSPLRLTGFHGQGARNRQSRAAGPRGQNTGRRGCRRRPAAHRRDSRAAKSLNLSGERTIPFDEASDLLFHRRESLPEHPNGMRFIAHNAEGTTLLAKTYFSVGGGFVVGDTTNAAHPDAPVRFQSPSHIGAATICCGLQVSQG